MTLLELAEQQAAFCPDPTPATYPYDVPARVDILNKLCALARKVQTGSLNSILDAYADLQDEA